MSSEMVEKIINFDVFGSRSRPEVALPEAGNEERPEPRLSDEEKFKRDLQKFGGLMLIFFFIGGSLLLLGLKITTRGPEALARMPLVTPTVAPEASGTANLMVVDLGGAVMNPGLYRLAPGARLSDLIAAGGGLSAAADPGWMAKNLNLAEKLTDGEKVYLPTKTEVLAGVAATKPINNVSGTAVLGAKSAKVNLNTAGPAALDTLPGIGPATAQAIIDFRQKNGPFKRIEDLQRVSGIGSAKFDKIKDLITVD